MNQKKNSKKISFPIVGIGASAGGLETLNAFFSIMPPDSNIAFVIIQHLSPNHKSIMASLLEKQTRMVVREIEDGAKLLANHGYLNPPGKNVAVFNRSLHLLEPIKSGTINMPVDFFFRSLSEDQGEKAIGIILSELKDKVKNYFNVQIFATDIDPAAIAFARKGIYPENIGVDISSARLNQFFTKKPDGFHIKKQIREMIVFSTQNLIKDPPFSKLDMVSCRNLMIYMGNVLQKKIIPLFHYTLNQGGILFLGTSESIGGIRIFSSRSIPNGGSLCAKHRLRVEKRIILIKFMILRRPISSLLKKMVCPSKSIFGPRLKERFLRHMPRPES